MTKKTASLPVVCSRRACLSLLSGGVLCGLLGLASGSAQAVEELYAPAPPAGSAFVRFINGTSSSAPLTLAGRAVGTLGAQEVSAYFVAAEGSRTATAGKLRLELALTAGNFYTVVQLGERLQLLQDVANPHLAKAQVTLYNLSSLPSVALKTANGAAVLVEKVAPMTQGQRAVNALTVDLAVFGEAGALQTFKGVSLAQGASYSAVVFPGTAAPPIRWSQNRTDTTR